MQKDKNGHLIFIAHRKKINEVYRFTKKNYVSHSLKHQISDAKSLQHIEDTIQDPDCITIGKNKEQKNYYRVVNYQKNKQSIAVRVYKLICYQEEIKDKKVFYTIATAIPFWTPNYQAIHYLEEIIWKKTNSLI